MNDKDLLRAFGARPCGDTFRPLLDQYLAFVYATAQRQLDHESQALEATRAVFLALFHRARKLPRNTVLVGWLFRCTRFAAARINRDRKRAALNGTDGQPFPGTTADDDCWPRLAPRLDKALDSLPAKLRDALLVRVFLNRNLEESARSLRTNERRVTKRVTKALDKLGSRLRKRGLPVDTEALARACASNGCAPIVPPDLASSIVAAALAGDTRGAAFELVRGSLRALAWARWKRRLTIAASCLGALVALVAAGALYLASLWRSGELMSWMMEWSVRRQAESTPGLAQPARPWPQDGSTSQGAPSIRTAADLYRTTNVWLAHIKFSADEWKAVSPKRIPPLPNFMQPDGTILLRNPKAQRSGLAGVLGYDFNWVQAEFELGDRTFPRVAARFKGNGTYLGSLYGVKRPFKVDLNKFAKSQRLGGIDEINLTNLIEDRSYMSDALAYELFRDAGVPAPRTAYTYLVLTVSGQWERRPLGLYLLVENVDADFAADRFGSKKTPIFKPVTYGLFHYLGDDWSAYRDIYDLKTKASPEQQRRVIEFARLVTHADPAEFQRRVGEFLDLDEFARFLAGLVLLSSYDGFFTNGQNFFIYLDPRSNKFGFIPWDLDHAWGGFPFVGSAATRELASIWRPWLGRNRFLERMMEGAEFREIYRARLDELVATQFVPERLFRRIDEIAAIIRSPVAAESDYRLERFDKAVGAQWLDGPRDGDHFGPNRPVHQLKRFITNRARSVREQLEGKSDGVVLQLTEPNRQ